MADIKLPSREIGSRPNPLDLGNPKQIYDYDYFSGANVSIYFGDILVDEITSITYSLRQDKRPVYGYSSYNWDFMAKGTTIVDGSFTINFKESAYLHVVMKHLGKVSKAARISGISPKERDTRNKQNNQIIKENVERVVNNANNENAYDVYNDLARLDDKTFENYAEVFEEEIWGASDDTIRTRRLAEYGGSSRGITHASQFEIHVAYGNLDDNMTNHTTRKITGIELIGQSQMIEISGEPLQEGYNFIARDVF